MRSRTPQIAIAVAAVLALAIAGCGDSEEPEGEKLPPAVTQELLQQLESVGDRVAAGVSGACDDIYAGASDGGNFEPIDTALSSVPANVDPEIRSALEQSIDRLKQLVDEECAEIGAAEQEEPEVTEEETTPTETETVETETVPAETETTETETDTTPTTPEAPPEVESPGRGPDGTGPPGLGGGAEAPDGGDE